MIDGDFKIELALIQFTDGNHAVLGMQARIRRDAGVGGANVFAEPVVVHLIDLVDEDETGFGEVVGGCHDGIPQAMRLDGLIDLAGDLALVIGDVVFRDRPVAPQYLAGVVQIDAVFFGFAGLDGEGELPVFPALHRLHEFIGDQQRQIELTQTAVFAFGADEIEDIGMADIEGGHLRATAATGRRDGEAHLVVDIHERQWAGGVGARAGDVAPPGPQGGELITDAATGLEGESCFVDLGEDVVHGITDGAGYGAVDGRGGGFVFLRPGVRGDAPGRDSAMAQRPQELLLPVLAFGRLFDFGQCFRDTQIGVFYVAVENVTGATSQPVFLVPDIE